MTRPSHLRSVSSSTPGSAARAVPRMADAAANPLLTRRRFLTTAALAGGGAVVAGCSLPFSSNAASTATAAAASTASPIFGDSSSENMTITVADGVRTIHTASWPDWSFDADFRYPGTPRKQDLTFRVTTDPQIAAQPTMVRTGQVFGVHRNSAVFDPTTAGYYGGRMGGAWNYNADALDTHGAHTRPDGFYHLHAVTPAWVSDPTAHSAFVGWAADGFPIYLRYGYVDPADPTSGVKDLQASYRLKAGSRPSGADDPGGTYDGTYVADYEYVAGLGDLDECNGRWCVTPEYPDGTYAYFLTDAWPMVPHWIKGTPDPSFAPGVGGGSAPARGRQAA